MYNRLVTILVFSLVSGTWARNLIELIIDKTHPCKAENLKLAVTYTCDKNGQWHCQTGWKQSDNVNQTVGYGFDQHNPCPEPICDPSCENGRCVEPDTCACEVGWFGNTCGECISLPGCIHGSCQKPFECNCELGRDQKTKGKYTGSHCNIPKCSDCIHGLCTEPDVCTCDYGWQGKTCNECIPLPGCKHGNCKGSPNTCQCDKGWKGHLCEVPICAKGCNLTNGYCNRPGECHCNTGWKGQVCNECIPHWDCPETGVGACTNPNECICKKRYQDNHACERQDLEIRIIGSISPKLSPKKIKLIDDLIKRMKAQLAALLKSV